MSTSGKRIRVGHIEALPDATDISLLDRTET